MLVVTNVQMEGGARLPEADRCAHMHFKTHPHTALAHTARKCVKKEEILHVCDYISAAAHE